MKEYVHEIPDHTQQAPQKRHFDVVVVGGGMSGLCAAMASARQGAKTALVQDRSVFGGNASSEMRMHISGASCHWGKRDAAETGILMELQLENKYLNDSYNYSIWDGVLWNAAQETKNLTLCMNTTMSAVHSDGKHISSIDCYQMTTELWMELTADVFVDATGNGTLGYMAGAEYKIGREGRDEYREEDAPDVPDGKTMGNTIYFVAEDRGHPVKFVKPSWAYTFDESDFKHRYHGDIVVYHSADDVVVLKPGEDYESHSDELVEKYDVKSGYWWIELGGDWDDIIRQSEDIRWELYRTVYGVWDHIKNGGDHGAENYELVWVGNLGGMRESRRLMGDYVLKEQDILANRIFEDAVAYGGWPMDEHTAAGFGAKGQIPSVVRSFKGHRQPDDGRARHFRLQARHGLHPRDGHLCCRRRGRRCGRGERLPEKADARAVRQTVYARAPAKAPGLRPVRHGAEKRGSERPGAPRLCFRQQRTARLRREKYHLRRHTPGGRAEQSLALRRPARKRRNAHADPCGAGACP